MIIKQEWFIFLSEVKCSFWESCASYRGYFNLIWLFRLQTDRFIQSRLCSLHLAIFFCDFDQKHDVGQYLTEYLKCDNTICFITLNTALLLKYDATTQYFFPSYPTLQWRTVLLRKRIVILVVAKFPMFYRSQMFVTVFTTGQHWSLSWVRWLELILSQYNFLTLIYSNDV